MSCNNTNPINRNYVEFTSWELHHRTAFNTCGYGTHGGTHSEEFNSGFWGVCGNAFNYIHVHTPSDYLINWVGDIGITVCKPGWHGYGRAFDLSQIRFTNGEFIDMNRDWRGTSCGGRGGNFKRRQYIGVWAALRRFTGTVLTGWYNADHQNHIHFDNGTAVGPIREGAETDTKLVQATCNYMNGESLAIDGAWGPLTEAAYGRLRTRLRMGCRNPKANTADALLFLHLIAQAGLKGQAAGAYTGPC
jgi:hypothetical protein